MSDVLEFNRSKILFNLTEDLLIAMEDVNVSKARLATDLVLSEKMLGDLLNGDEPMTLDTLITICHILDVELIINMKHNSEVGK